MSVVISSNLSRADLVAIFQDEADYDLVRSLEKAKRFIQAGRMLLANPITRTASGGRGGEEIELDVDQLKALITKAEGWYHNNYAASEVELRQLVPDDEYRG